LISNIAEYQAAATCPESFKANLEKAQATNLRVINATETKISTDNDSTA